MTYRFSRENFNKNADRTVKKILSKHLNYIDGLEINFGAKEEWGIIETYVVETEKYCLYPVLKEW